MEPNKLKAKVPFDDIGIILLDCIFHALKVCVKESGKLNPSDPILLKCFEPFFTRKYIRGQNPHLFAGNTSKAKYETRLTKVVLHAYHEIQADSKIGRGINIPSPLHILYNILTFPDEPQSSAYALLFCRSLLFETFKVFPEHPLMPTGYKSFNIDNVTNALNTFKSYAVESNNIPQSENVPDQLMLAHFLAMKGVFYFRFGTKEGRKAIKDRDELLNFTLTYLNSKNINGPLDSKKAFEFHKLNFFDELPESATLMNELSGIPIPIRGAETIFQGGIKTDSNSNLVLRISGEPGTGKTSLALALCAVLSPFNTFSYYMTLEENPDDLRNRLFSLIPSYLKKLSVYNPDVKSWFWAEKIPLGSKNRLEFFESEYIDQIYEKLKKKKTEFRRGYLPAVCPLVIIIDSIRVLLNEDNSNLDRFIEKCKKLNAIIVLISANDESFHNEIDYMIDTVIHLKYSGTENQNEKPIRILQLTKTRHQISRPGSHVFHLSGEKGVRIAPQLPSQIDKKEIIKRPQPSKDNFINFFNEIYSFKNSRTNLMPKLIDNTKQQLRIWDKSQILLHGHGSSGKAGLALSILLSPPLNKKYKNIINSDFGAYRAKVLIISLLYPDEYYREIKEKIIKRQNQKTNINHNALIKTLFFYSGYITPEDFIGKILRELDAAILNGEAYTGILLDGLHNVSLQFRNLQECDMLWPTLYGLLIKYSITIINTFTNFDIDKYHKSTDHTDNELLLKGQLPLLHSLVGSNDYYITIEPPSEKEQKVCEGRYIITFRSVIRQEQKIIKYIWDRERRILHDYLP